MLFACQLMCRIMRGRTKKFLGLKKKTGISFLALLVCCLAILPYQGEIRGWQRKKRAYRRLFSCVEQGHRTAKTLPLGAVFPAVLQDVPLGESTGIVVGAKTVTIRNVPGRYYNASLIEHEKGYLLFFRYDVIDSSYIGCAELDATFEQTDKEFKTINTQSHHAEDPRLFKRGEDLYLVYNDCSTHHPGYRTMRIAGLNREDCSLNFMTDLDLHAKPIEKNWVPFEWMDANNQRNVYFEYYLYPRKILQLANAQLNEAPQLSFLEALPAQKLYWPHVWGRIRGGTNVCRIGDQFLGFFHSNFRTQDKSLWYVMGAYTFEATPPFRLTAISPYPILFEGIYGALPGTKAALHCIYPCGYVIHEQGGKEWIQLSCGENDSSIKIVTLDKEALLKTLTRLNL